MSQKRKKTDDERLSSIISDINAITSQGWSGKTTGNEIGAEVERGDLEQSEKSSFGETKLVIEFSTAKDLCLNQVGQEVWSFRQRKICLYFNLHAVLFHREI